MELFQYENFLNISRNEFENLLNSIEVKDNFDCIDISTFAFMFRYYNLFKKSTREKYHLKYRYYLVTPNFRII